MLKLRPYQEKLKREIYEAWNSGYKNVLAVMPTGGGKTRTFCSIAHDMAILQKYPTAIEVHRKELVQQICLTLAEVGLPHNIIAPRSTILGIIAAERKMFGKQFYDYKAPITVLSVDTLNSRITKHEQWAKSIKFWIVDEATHVLKNNKWGKSLEYFPNAIGLGVTATPQRLDKRGLGSHADGVFDVMIQGPNTRWMIEQGFLSKYKVVVPESDYRQHLKEASDGHDFTREAMAQASLKSHIVGDVYTNYKKFADGQQAIVFCTDIMSGQKMEAEFNKNGTPAKLLTGDTDDKVRLNALIEFREKKTKVLLNVDLFDEGLDVPNISVVILARPTKSVGKFLQSIGRGLRPSADKEYAIIIDHVGNIKEHGLPCQHRAWTLDRIVKRRDKVNLIRICMNHMCSAPFDRLLSACPYCGWDDQSSGVSREASPKAALKQVDGDLMLLDPEQLRDIEAEAVLEDPAAVAQRVSRAAGGAAGMSAMKNQRERIETQKGLAEVVALWAGKQRQWGRTDRMIHKYFYLKFDMTISTALGQTKADMLRTKEELEDEIGIRNTTTDTD